MTFLFNFMAINDAKRTIDHRISDRVECPKHGRTMVLVRHELSTFGRNSGKIGYVEFYRCSYTEPMRQDKHRHWHGGEQCNFMRPNKYQVRKEGERHK